MFIKVNVFFSK